MYYFKTITIVSFLFVSIGNLQAKKVKFTVDMRNQIVDTAGVHITGDFQDEAGYIGGDWITNTALMLQEIADTNIYSVVVDIPAFRHYEFKYVNGDQGYQQEFVPLESRVNYNFLDNRWIYIDSLSNDTQSLAPVRFGENAPNTKNLIRLYVDMQNETINSNGVHVTGAFQSWNPATTQMFSFDGMVYEYIFYVDSGNVATEREFKFLNGNAIGDYELLAGWCANQNGFRSVIAPRDTMMPVVCYTFCAACSTVGIAESIIENPTKVMPNPSNGVFKLEFGNSDARLIQVYDIFGKNILTQVSENENSLKLNLTEKAAGLFSVVIYNVSDGSLEIIKVVTE
ncbi:hypothetical protein BH09BAC5_BH09BAC5_16330 [soil metagenome]